MLPGVVESPEVVRGRGRQWRLLRRAEALPTAVRFPWRLLSCSRTRGVTLPSSLPSRRLALPSTSRADGRVDAATITSGRAFVQAARLG